MPNAQNDERLRAYRLRDIVRRRRRELTEKEARWLKAYDKEHPPRGSRRAAEPRGEPIPPADASGLLQPERIPVAAAPPAPAAEAEPLGVTATEEEEKQEPGPIPLVGEAPPISVSGDATSQSSISNLAIATVIGGLFAVEVVNLAKATHRELPTGADAVLAEGASRAWLNKLNQWFPDTTRSDKGDLLVVVGSGGVIAGGPAFRKWLEKREQKAEDEAQPSTSTREENERRVVAEQPAARQNTKVRPDVDNPTIPPAEVPNATHGYE